MLIYRIFNDNHSYVGSTVNMYNRMAVHKCPTAKRPCCSKIIIEEGNYQVEILEECSDDKRLEREQYWFSQFPDLVNKNNTYNTKNWDKENAEFMKQWKKQWKKYQDSWGGDKRYNNNFLEIDYSLFE